MSLSTFIPAWPVDRAPCESTRGPSLEESKAHDFRIWGSQPLMYDHHEFMAI